VGNWSSAWWTGTVILFHEWRRETLQQLPRILAELRREGCTFLTFSERAEVLPDGRK
jgi:peptidoglycan/xylan/chitin deacetylase (PgdA/CDA1 family)